MKIGITGATGQLGRFVVEKLKERTAAENLVALVRSPEKVTDLGVEARVFDYSKPETLAEGLKGVDRLLLISSNEVGKRFEQHSNVVEAAKKAGVQLLAYTSLLRADTSTLILAQEHLRTEEKLVESGLPVVVLRNGWYTENYTGSLAAAVANGVLYGSSGAGKISSAARADFAEAAAVVLTTEGHAGKTYELAGDDAYTMSEFAAELSKQAGKDVVYKNVSTEEYTAVLIGFGLPEGFAQFYAGMEVSIEKGDLFEDQKQLSSLIGRPTTPLTDVFAAAL